MKWETSKSPKFSSWKKQHLCRLNEGDIIPSLFTLIIVHGGSLVPWFIHVITCCKCYLYLKSRSISFSSLSRDKTCNNPNYSYGKILSYNWKEKTNNFLTKKSVLKQSIQLQLHRQCKSEHSSNLEAEGVQLQLQLPPVPCPAESAELCCNEAPKLGRSSVESLNDNTSNVWREENKLFSLLVRIYLKYKLCKVKRYTMELHTNGIIFKL